MLRRGLGATLGAGLLLPLLCGAAQAQAQAVDDRARPTGGEDRAADSARAGMFLALIEAPRVDTQRAFTTVLGGYDAARDSALLEGRGEVTVWGPIALRIGVLYTQTPEQLRPTGGARVQALSQADDQAFDLSLGAFYKPEGFTEGEGEIEGVIAFGRRYGRVGLFADLVYGQDPEGAERDGEVRLGALYEAMARMQLGLDSRLRFDLGSDEGKRRAEGEAEYDLIAGPALSYALDQIALGIEAGVSVVGSPGTQVGPIALASVSGSF